MARYELKDLQILPLFLIAARTDKMVDFSAEKLRTNVLW